MTTTNIPGRAPVTALALPVSSAAGYRAITVKREFAERMFLPISDPRHKRFEFRRFGTDYRGWGVVTISQEKIAYGIVKLQSIHPAHMVALTFGYVPSAQELAYGNRAWHLAEPRRCQPVKCKGKLGLWTWEGELPPLLEVSDA